MVAEISSIAINLSPYKRHSVVLENPRCLVITDFHYVSRKFAASRKITQNSVLSIINILPATFFLFIPLCCIAERDLYPDTPCQSSPPTRCRPAAGFHQITLRNHRHCAWRTSLHHGFNALSFVNKPWLGYPEYQASSRPPYKACPAVYSGKDVFFTGSRRLRSTR